MSLVLFRSNGGALMLPARASLLASREHGGNLVVSPPRPVWERSELTPAELAQFAFLAAAAGRAMLDVLPQLVGGCINIFIATDAECSSAGRRRRAARRCPAGSVLRARAARA